jgi:hypothetical protein
MDDSLTYGIVVMTKTIRDDHEKTGVDADDDGDGNMNKSEATRVHDSETAGVPNSETAGVPTELASDSNPSDDDEEIEENKGTEQQETPEEDMYHKSVWDLSNSTYNR